MGRYVQGTKNFSYKYVFAAQSSNLSELAGWSGIEQAEQQWSLATQFYVPYRKSYEDRWDFVTGVGPLHACYSTAVPPFDLVDNVEGAIDAVCSSWQEVVRGIDDYLPGPALSPDVAGGQSFVLRKSEWGALSARIGHGADPSDLISLEAARDIVFTSGEDDYLPLLAVNALIHATKHDLVTFEMADVQRRDTNLWEVADHWAGPFDDSAPWEERAVHARLLTFQRRRAEAEPLLKLLLVERPSAIQTARALVAGYLWDENWSDMHALADELLAPEQSDAMRGELLLWRGEATCRLKSNEDALSDAKAASDLGRDELLVLIAPDA